MKPFNFAKFRLLIFVFCFVPLTVFGSENARENILPLDSILDDHLSTNVESIHQKPVDVGPGLTMVLASAPTKTVGTNPQFKFQGKQQGCVNSNGVRGLNANFRGQCGDLQEQDLTNADLQNKDLSGANLRGSNLTGTNLQKAILVGALLAEATLSGTNLADADLTQADLTGANLSNTKLTGAKLTQANLSETIIRNTDLRGTKLDQTMFTKAILFRVNLSGLDLTNLNWEGVEITASNLSGAILTGLNFENGFCDKTEFVKADLRHVNFTKAEMYRVNLIGANLQGALLSQAMLAWAKLSGAQLQHADLSQADLSNADLSGASLAKANLQKAILNKAVLKRADLQNTNLSGTSLSGASLTKANLRGANLIDAVVGDQGRIMSTGNPDFPLLYPTEVAGAICDQATQLPHKLRCRNQVLGFVASARVARASIRPSKPSAKLASDVLLPGTTPTKKNWPSFLEAIRGKIMTYAETLPNFVCSQATRRYRQIGRGGWRQENYSVQELSYLGNQKHYKNIGAGDSPPQSADEFDSAVAGLFDYQTKAIFKFDGMEKIKGRQVVRIRYQVPKKSSNRMLHFPDKSKVVYGYEGNCWIDLEDYQVVRFRAKTNKDIPKNSLLKGYELSIDFQKIQIATGFFYMPMRLQEIVKTSISGSRNLTLFTGSGQSAAPMASGGVAGSSSGNYADLSIRFVTLFQQYREFDPR